MCASPREAPAQRNISKYIFDFENRQDAEIRLPPEGVRLNAKFSMACIATNGNIPFEPPTYLDYVAPIGSFLETSEYEVSLLLTIFNTQISILFFEIQSIVGVMHSNKLALKT